MYESGRDFSDSAGRNHYYDEFQCWAVEHS